MEMLIKETRNESFLRNHRNSLTKQLINPSAVASVTAVSSNATTNSSLLPMNRKKFVKNTNFDKAEFEKLISNTTNHNKITNLMNSQTTSISIAKTDTAFTTSDTVTKLDLNVLEIEDKYEDDDFKKLISSSISGKKSSKNTKTKPSNKTLQQQKSIDLPTSTTTNNSNNMNTQTKKIVKKDKKSKKKSKTSANDNRTCIEQHESVDSFSHAKPTTNTNDLLSASKSSLFPKVAPQRDTTAYKSFKSRSNKPKEETAPAPAPPPPPLPSLVQLPANESLRWDKRMDDPDEEARRIELYKLNRRKRYIEQRNKYLNLNSSTARSSNLFSMYENDDYDSESTQNNLNNEETSSIYESKEATTTNTNTNTTTANLLASESTTRLLSSDIFNKMKLKELSNITDSAISSMSSNSR